MWGKAKDSEPAVSGSESKRHHSFGRANFGVWLRLVSASVSSLKH